jgi:hypothetical protein
MPKVTGRRGFGRGSGTVTVIETKVHRSSARKARMAFVVAAFVVGLLTMTVAADRMHPVLAMLLGTAIGIPAGALVWVLVRIWPVIRLIWWWTPEISLALIVVYGWIGLAEHTNLAVRLAVVTVLVGVPALVPWLRKRLVALAWCVIVRHRLRTCFAQFIVSNQSGSLPLIFLSRPTPVGERVWVQLRPGLALSDLTNRLDKIAVACWADSVVIERASSGNAGMLRVDVKRREVLTATVSSPLVDDIDPDAPAPLRSVGDVPTALDLPDVAKQGSTKPEREARKPAPQPESEPARAVASHGGEDISDWI